MFSVAVIYMVSEKGSRDKTNPRSGLGKLVLMFPIKVVEIMVTTEHLQNSCNAWDLIHTSYQENELIFSSQGWHEGLPTGAWTHQIVKPSIVRGS